MGSLRHCNCLRHLRLLSFRGGTGPQTSVRGGPSFTLRRGRTRPSNRTCRDGCRLGVSGVVAALPSRTGPRTFVSIKRWLPTQARTPTRQFTRPHTRGAFLVLDLIDGPSQSAPPGLWDQNRPSVSTSLAHRSSALMGLPK